MLVRPATNVIRLYQKTRIGSENLPRTVDHDERRAKIADALVRIAATDGLHAVTMRSVAAEAGVSLRLVQYYFGTKADLMNAALRRLEEESHRRLTARLATLPDNASARAFIDAFFVEALPTDCESRRFHLVWTSYALLAATDPELSRQPISDGPARMERQLAAVLRDAQQIGEISAKRDASYDAVRLLALNHGLGTGVLIGLHTPDEAVAIFSGHLDEIFCLLPGEGT